MLDRDDPSQLLIRGNEWVFGPELDYERSGDVPDVVFPCGWLLNEEDKSLRMYYGAADTCVCVATTHLDRLINYLYKHCICGEIHQPGECCPQASREPVEISGTNRIKSSV